MFNIRREGEDFKPGFNFYPLDDKFSFGFIYRTKAKLFWCRWSKHKSRWNIHTQTLPTGEL